MRSVADLHLYHGMMPDTRVGMTFGQEFIGEVHEVGPSVQNLKVGDRVLVPFNVFGDKPRTDWMTTVKDRIYGGSWLGFTPSARTTSSIWASLTPRASNSSGVAAMIRASRSRRRSAWLGRRGRPPSTVPSAGLRSRMAHIARRCGSELQ